MKITHKRISAAPPSYDDDLVSGDDWNAAHAVSGPRAVAVGFTAPGEARIQRGGGVLLEPASPWYIDPEPGEFILRLLPSAGFKFGTISQAMNAGIFVAFEPRDRTRDIYGYYPPQPEYPGLTIGGIKVQFMNQLEYATDPDGDTILALSPEEGAYPARVIKGLYFRAFLVDENGYPAYYIDEETGDYMTPDPMPWFDFKITVWVGVFDNAYAPDGTDAPEDDLWLIPDGYQRTED